MIPGWFETFSIAMLVLGGVCALIIAVDEWHRPQHMAIMNLVWPVTAPFGTAWIVWQYFTYGRLATHHAMRGGMEHDQAPISRRATPFPMMVANGTLHYGTGCH